MCIYPELSHIIYSYKNWEQIDQRKVNAVFGVNNGEWKAYYQQRTDRPTQKEYRYVRPGNRPLRLASLSVFCYLSVSKLRPASRTQNFILTY